MAVQLVSGGVLPLGLVQYCSQHSCVSGCNPEDLPKAMNDREKWRERVRDIRARGTT